jgi:hypothetical protein
MQLVLLCYLYSKRIQYCTFNFTVTGITLVTFHVGLTCKSIQPFSRRLYRDRSPYRNNVHNVPSHTLCLLYWTACGQSNGELLCRRWWNVELHSNRDYLTQSAVQGRNLSSSDPFSFYWKLSFSHYVTPRYECQSCEQYDTFTETGYGPWAIGY